MVSIEGGEFDMGGESILVNTKPIHRVRLDDFQLCRFPVNQQLWCDVMGSDPEALWFEGRERPVERVSWDDCQAFLQRLNALTAGGYRLPTEAEWEYAAREGRYNRHYEYSGSSRLQEVGFFRDNSFSETLPAGYHRPNAMGLYDLSGNVEEWCEDWYDGDYYQHCADQGTVSNPTGPESGDDRVYRGGSWLYSAGRARVSDRDGWRPDLRDGNLGFRLARS